MVINSNTAGLEGLVAGPYRWNATTYSSFFRDVYDNVIKAEVERLQILEVEKRKQAELGNQKEIDTISPNCYDVKIAKLVQNLIKDSDKVLGSENWTDMIGKEFWDILKLDEFGKDRYKLDSDKDESAALKKKSLVQLLKFIRNKISHIRTCKDDMKDKLKEFFDKDENDHYQINEHKFVTFWISKFPKLVPFLWLKLYKFRENLVNYYPDYEIEIGKLQNFLGDINKFQKEIQIALSADMENGNILKRFKGSNCSLEFRGFPNLVKILDKNVFIKFLLNVKRNIIFSVEHSSTNQAELEYKGTAPGTEKLIIFFTDNITDKKIWKYCSNCNCRVIMFCDPDKLTNEKTDEAVHKFKYENDISIELSELPIRGNELSEEKQDWVFENGQVLIQGKIIKIKDIITDKTEIMEVLSGDLLNQILKQEMPVIFGKYKYPEYNGVYINRRIYLSGRNGRGKTKNWKKELALENARYEKELAKLFRTKEMVPMHSCAKCTPCHVRNTGINGVFEEVEFLRRITREKIKSVYILAKTGMGKSKLLISLGKCVKNSLVVFCSFRNFLEIFKKIGVGEVFDKSDIKSVILEILKCQSERERELIANWLERKGNKGAQVELQLDGLDEVPSGNLKIALRALEIIKKDFHAVRLWISSSKPFPSAQMELRFTYFGILPFSLKDKMNFFKMSCRAKGLPEDKIEHNSLCFSMRFIADNELVAFLDYPLNYSMIFELYEDNLDELIILGGKGVGIEVFDSHYQKKFAIMYREKKGINLDDTDEDFIMQREMYLQLYTYLAFVHLFPQVASKFVEPLGMQFFTKENYHKMGIITNNEPITFIHLKYADYFVARYIMKILEMGKTDVLCPEESFVDLLSFGSPDKEEQAYRPSIWKFVDEYLEEISDLNSLKWLETHRSQNLKRMSTEKNMSRFLLITFGCSLWNLAKLLINLWLDETDVNYCNKILFLAIISQPSSEWFISVCEKLSFDNPHDLIICSVRQGHYEIAKYLIEEKSGDDIFDKIAEKRENNGGILHCLVDLFNRGHSDASLFDSLTNSFVEKTINFVRYVVVKSRNEIDRKDSRGRNFLLALPLILKPQQSDVSSKCIFPLKEFLINEMNVDINERSLDGDSILCMGLDMNYQHPKFCPTDHMFMNCQQKSNSERMEVYYKTLAFVTSRNFLYINVKSKEGGLTPLQEAVYFFGSNLNLDLLDIFRASGADFNVKDGAGDTILHYCVKNCDDIEFIKLLVQYGCKIDVQNDQHLCALCFAKNKRKLEIVIFFRKMLKLKGKQKCRLNCCNI